MTTHPEPKRQPLPAPVAAALAIPKEKRTPEQQATIVKYLRSMDPELARLEKAVRESPPPPDVRLVGAQDLAWALINSPAFLFNR